MGQDTAIEWAHHTFNPWWGCTKVPGDPACHHCYAEAWAKRMGKQVWGKQKPRWSLTDGHWNKPLRWDRLAKEAGERHRVFCASMADVFEDREDLHAARVRLWSLIEATPHLDWLLLTKRPERLPLLEVQDRSNVWLGTTAANQTFYDLRVPVLLQHEAAVHFVSAEPLLGSIELQGRPRVDWIIVGGESGPKARPMDPAWVTSIHKGCEDQAIAFFFKQWGGKDKKRAGRELFGRTFDELPVPKRH